MKKFLLKSIHRTLCIVNGREMERQLLLIGICLLIKHTINQLRTYIKMEPILRKHRISTSSLFCFCFFFTVFTFVHRIQLPRRSRLGDEMQIETIRINNKMDWVVIEIFNRGWSLEITGTKQIIIIIKNSNSLTYQLSECYLIAVAIWKKYFGCQIWSRTSSWKVRRGPHETSWPSGHTQSLRERVNQSHQLNLEPRHCRPHWTYDMTAVAPISGYEGAAAATLREFCANLHVEVGTVPRDGYCLFHSIAVLLGIETDAVTRAVRQFLQEKWSELERYDVDGRGMGAFVAQTSGPEADGTTMHLEVACRCYNITAILHCLPYGTRTVFGNGPTVHELVLFEGHFVPITRTQTMSVSIFQFILFYFSIFHSKQS